MRKFDFLFFFTLLLVTSNLFAQKDVTMFLGIPIDGSKDEMLNKLKSKGFKNNPHSRDVLSGEFNGTDVNIHVVTNNNKVYRIMVTDVNTRNESDIKIRYNNLCQQFSNNKKYVHAVTDAKCEISDDEDISFQMLVKDKRYEAIYYQISDSTPEDLQSFISSKYPPEQLVDISREFRDQMIEDYSSYFAQTQTKKVVWYMITENSGRYNITMYYDNEYNNANGEDL